LKRFLIVILLAAIALSASAQIAELPGVVINHSPASKGKYLGSPSICILPNGRYVASHDYFGPKTKEFETAITDIFVSDDKGASWQKSATLRGQFWSSLFYHNGAIYIFGTCRHHGNIVIRKSTDGGESWSNPYDAKNGLIVEGEYHTAPTPVLVHNGRIYKAFEYATHKVRKWGRRYSAMVISASVNADLLDAKSWRCSNILYSDPSWLGGEFRGWLEGNVVYDHKQKQLLNILRVGTIKGVGVEQCARVAISSNGKQISFDTERGFQPFPGGAKKFTIRYDERTGKYWTLVNNTDPEKLVIKNDKTRNTLSLYSSTDLLEWRRERTLIDHPDIYHHGVQYVDWQFEGEDIVAVIRTAWEDEEGNAHNQHDSNYILFHRVTRFAENTTLK
ncbi:MAG: exo-alpha-sialidase, partial [Alistipes sp.]|nr:exo-alpha-sialidase [Alistipes sp.]